MNMFCYPIYKINVNILFFCVGFNMGEYISLVSIIYKWKSIFSTPNTMEPDSNIRHYFSIFLKLN